MNASPIDTWRILIFLGGIPLVLIIAMVILLGLSFFFYRRHPGQIISQKKLRALIPEQDKKLIASVQSLASSAGVEPMPVIMIGPNTQDGQVFGTKNRTVLRLGQKLKLMQVKSEYKSAYKAIILHEMAHIFNDDVLKTYFAEAMWRAFRIIASILSLLLLLTYIPGYIEGQMPIVLWPIILLPIFFITLFKLVIILVALQWIWRTTLRMREIYADLRAAYWGAFDGLVQILSSAKERNLRWWKKLWLYHPKESERLHYLQDKTNFFKIKLDASLTMGFLAGMALAGISPVITKSNALYLAADSSFGNALGFVAIGTGLLFYLGFGLVLAWLLATSLGLQVQRQAVVDRFYFSSGAWPYFRLFIPAFLYHIAFEIGVYMTPYNTLQIDPFLFILGSIRRAQIFDPNLIANLYSFLLFPVWILFSTCTLFYWLVAIRFVSKRFIGAAMGDIPPRGRIRLVTALSTFSLPFLYIPSALARNWLLTWNSENLKIAVISLFVVSLAVMIASVIAWILLTVTNAKPAICPSCQQQASTNLSKAIYCSNCHMPFSIWLFRSPAVKEIKLKK